MAATTKLIVYNEVLREIGATFRLANLATPRPELAALEGAFAHAVEYLLSRRDWNFLRRRAAVISVADGAFAPYTRRFGKPGDYLRKVWLKVAAGDPFQIEHAEVGAVIYAFETAALLEYMSDDAANADPANWPPQFTRCMVLYLTLLVGPGLARAGLSTKAFDGRALEDALAEAEASEVVFTGNVAIPAARVPVLRRAFELIGNELSSSVVAQAVVDRARWKMNAGWDHAVRWCLEAGAWNFATRRAALTGGTVGFPRGDDSAFVEGYFVGPAPTGALAEPVSEFDYGYLLPVGFLHKIWVKRDANDDRECRYQIVRNVLMADVEPVVLEYVSSDDYTLAPANWPAMFTEVVASRLATLGAAELPMKANEMAHARRLLEALVVDKLADAKMKDAIQQATSYAPVGAFVLARRGGWARR